MMWKKASTWIVWIAFLFLSGCVLDELPEYGESCEKIAYVLEDESVNDEPTLCLRSHCPEYDEWISKDLCPIERPFCIQGLLQPIETSYCASFCPPGTTAIKSKDSPHTCVTNNSIDNCGVKGTRCADEDPNWVDGTCGQSANSSEILCRATECKPGTRPNGSGICKPIHDCCGLFCAICNPDQVCPGESLTENYNCQASCGEGLKACQGVCVPEDHAFCISEQQSASD